MLEGATSYNCCTCSVSCCTRIVHNFTYTVDYCTLIVSCCTRIVMLSLLSDRGRCTLAPLVVDTAGGDTVSLLIYAVARWRCEMNK